MIALLQWFNEAILMPTAVELNVAARLVRAFYFGFRAGAVEAGASLTLSSIISGFIVTGLCWHCCGLVRASSVDTG
jgi:hypothetical protein